MLASACYVTVDRAFLESRRYFQRSVSVIMPCDVFLCLFIHLLVNLSFCLEAPFLSQSKKYKGNYNILSCNIYKNFTVKIYQDFVIIVNLFLVILTISHKCKFTVSHNSDFKLWLYVSKQESLHAIIFVDPNESYPNSDSENLSNQSKLIHIFCHRIQNWRNHRENFTMSIIACFALMTRKLHI